MLNRLIFLAILIVGAARFCYVETFAVAMPYWDQWDAEGDFLLRPWIEGRLKLSDLWQPHNEHRIFPTRVLSLIIFQLTGAWNNLTEARLNILLAVSIPVMLIWFLGRRKELFGIRWLVPTVIIAQFALPFSFENLLVGFQSQFYFLLIFTVISLILATLYPENGWAIATILVLSLLSVVTMASGLLTPMAVGGVYLLNWYLGENRTRANVLVVIILLTFSVGGYLSLTQIPGNQAYRAENFSEFIAALGYILSWPVVDSQWSGILLWLSGAITIPLLLFDKKLTKTDLFMAGCFIWSFSQGMAIAYGRGQELTEVASRYTELFSLGLISNAWFAARFTEQLSKYPFRWATTIFFIVFAYGHITRYSADMHDIRRNHQLSLTQIRNVRMYLKTRDKSVLDQPKFQIPYPDPVRLQQLLEDPTLSKILPLQ